MYGDIDKTKVTIDRKPLEFEIAERVEDLKIDEQLKMNMARGVENFQGLERAQQIAIPTFLKNELDMVVISPTGSGKTATYALPILNDIVRNASLHPQISTDSRSSKCQFHYPRAIIIVPTRELAVQIRDVFTNLARNIKGGIRIILAIGGLPTDWGKKNSNEQPTIVIGTAGRIIAELGYTRDLDGNIIEKPFPFDERDTPPQKFASRISLKSIRFIVLDEADRLVRKGYSSFYKDMEHIYEQSDLPSHCFSFMFSATFPPNAQAIARRFLFEDHIRVEIAEPGTANKCIQQDFTKSFPKERIEDPESKAFREVESEKTYQDLATRVLNELKRANDFRILIFIDGSNRSFHDMHNQLLKYNIEHVMLNDQMRQPDRLDILRKFTSGDVRVMIANALAERGLDIPKLDVVINFHLPTTMANYVQRIGRTGRAGRTGRSITYWPANYSDFNFALAMSKVLKGAGQKVPPCIEEIVGKDAPQNISEFKNVPSNTQKPKPENPNSTGKKKKLNTRQRKNKKKAAASAASAANSITTAVQNLSVSEK
ncbi:hypothetical protein WR25_27295 isoform C [Diploscapter pachys]|nr:hypothetical protein WR25_27295 isoform C [Diploscapter pachys]